MTLLVLNPRLMLPLSNSSKIDTFQMWESILTPKNQQTLPSSKRPLMNSHTKHSLQGQVLGEVLTTEESPGSHSLAGAPGAGSLCLCRSQAFRPNVQCFLCREIGKINDNDDSMHLLSSYRFQALLEMFHMLLLI